MHLESPWLLYRRGNQKREGRFAQIWQTRTQLKAGTAQVPNWPLGGTYMGQIQITPPVHWNSFLLLLEKLHGGGGTWKWAFRNLSEISKEKCRQSVGRDTERDMGVDVAFHRQWGLGDCGEGSGCCGGWGKVRCRGRRVGRAGELNTGLRWSVRQWGELEAAERGSEVPGVVVWTRTLAAVYGGRLKREGAPQMKAGG